MPHNWGLDVNAAQRLWQFIERCEATNSMEGVGGAFIAEMADLGFPYVALSSHVDPLNPPPGAVMVLRYPESWVAHYSSEQYQQFDPVFDYARTRSTPFWWSDARFQARIGGVQKRVLAEGAEAGIRNGVTIPIRGPDALPASCSLVADRDGVDPQMYTLVHALAVYAHERARRIYAATVLTCEPRLTERERECLMLVARGKSDWVISCLLGTSEKAVNRTIERAKKRLGVATRTQAIIRALHSGEISLYDIAD
ncbi:MAG: LuxR family transcriptional regulator [Hyphomonadaceae bacterium]|nr:LuxR family transcriptional regulator [Hyphomonadaceae bacterium]